MKKTLSLLLCVCMLFGMFTATAWAADYITIKSANVKVEEPVAGKAYSTKATMADIHEDVYLEQAKWEGTFGGANNNEFIDGNTYKVTVVIGISDLAQGTIKPSSSLKINSYPIESYELLYNNKVIKMEADHPPRAETL